MAIYYDVSEGREGTRLDQNIVDVGKPLQNLEMITGADLLVTPFEKNISLPTPIANLITEKRIRIVELILKDNTPAEIAKDTGISMPAAIQAVNLWTASQMGILVQRKSGQDFTSSIPKLHEIESRMLLWTPDPWLLIAANIGSDRNGKAVVDGKAVTFTYRQVVSAKTAWMFYGGNVLEVSRDNLSPLFFEYTERKLDAIVKNPTKLVARRTWARQHLVGSNDKRWRWMNILMGFDGIGALRAKRIADYCGSLVKSLVFLSDTNAVEALGDNDIARISDSLKFRKLLEIADDNTLAEVGNYEPKK